MAKTETKHVSRSFARTGFDFGEAESFKGAVYARLNTGAGVLIWFRTKRNRLGRDSQRNNRSKI